MSSLVFRAAVSRFNGQLIVKLHLWSTPLVRIPGSAEGPEPVRVPLSLLARAGTNLEASTEERSVEPEALFAVIVGLACGSIRHCGDLDADELSAQLAEHDAVALTWARLADPDAALTARCWFAAPVTGRTAADYGAAFGRALLARLRWLWATALRGRPVDTVEDLATCGALGALEHAPVVAAVARFVRRCLGSGPVARAKIEALVYGGLGLRELICSAEGCLQAAAALRPARVTQSATDALVACTGPELEAVLWASPLLAGLVETLGWVVGLERGREITYERLLVRCPVRLACPLAPAEAYPRGGGSPSHTVAHEVGDEIWVALHGGWALGPDDAPPHLALGDSGVPPVSEAVRAAVARALWIDNFVRLPRPLVHAAQAVLDAADWVTDSAVRQFEALDGLRDADVRKIFSAARDRYVTLLDDPTVALPRSLTGAHVVHAGPGIVANKRVSDGAELRLACNGRTTFLNARSVAYLEALELRSRGLKAAAAARAGARAAGGARAPGAEPERKKHRGLGRQ